MVRGKKKTTTSIYCAQLKSLQNKLEHGRCQQPLVTVLFRHCGSSWVAGGRDHISIQSPAPSGRRAERPVNSQPSHFGVFMCGRPQAPLLHTFICGKPAGVDPPVLVLQVSRCLGKDRWALRLNSIIWSENRFSPRLFTFNFPLSIEA